MKTAPPLLQCACSSPDLKARKKIFITATNTEGTRRRRSTVCAADAKHPGDAWGLDEVAVWMSAPLQLLTVADWTHREVQMESSVGLEWRWTSSPDRWVSAVTAVVVVCVVVVVLVWARTRGSSVSSWTGPGWRPGQLWRCQAWWGLLNSAFQ